MNRLSTKFRHLVLLACIFFNTTTFALGTCSIDGNIDAEDSTVSTKVRIVTTISGPTKLCEDVGGQTMTWDIAIAIAEIYKGADMAEETRFYQSTWETKVEHDKDSTTLGVEFDIVLNEYEGESDPFSYYCFVGKHGARNGWANSERFGDNTMFCGELGLYSLAGGGGTQTGGGGGGTNDPLCNMITGALPASCYNDPLIIDLGQDGIHLGLPGNGVKFDINATGQRESIQWLAPKGNEAFLVRDLNQNGQIDDGSELFGNGTALISPLSKPNSSQTLARNGFEALAQFDQPHLGGNGDGLISEDDVIWSELQLWLDVNADARTDAGELHLLQNIGIEQIDIIPKHNGRKDRAGNLLPLWSWASGDANGEKFKMADVVFSPLKSPNAYNY